MRFGFLGKGKTMSYNGGTYKYGMPEEFYSDYVSRFISMQPLRPDAGPGPLDDLIYCPELIFDNVLTRRQWQAIEGRYCGETFKEIGARLGVCGVRAQQITFRAHMRLRRAAMDHLKKRGQAS